MARTPRQGGRTRRHLLRAIFTLGVTGGTAAALTPVLRARDDEPDARTADPRAATDGGTDDGANTAVIADEMYRGRHIRVAHGRGGTPAAMADHGAARGVMAPPAYDIRIDGRPLPLMRRADGSYLSMVDHYESFPTPLAAARAAVDNLYGARLAAHGPMAPGV